MKRAVCFALPAALLLLLAGCGGGYYSHLSDDDFMNDRYYLAAVNPGDHPDGETPIAYGVFEKVRDGRYALLVEAGKYIEIYGARNKTLAVDGVLYIVRENDLLRYDLTASAPEETLLHKAGFFPGEMEVLILNGADRYFYYVYALLPERPPAAVVRLAASESYAGYFAVRRDGTGYREVTFDDIPVQKRY